MLGARARLRIQERVLGIKVVKTALRNYFENRQGLITEDTYRQFAARYKFFHQQFAIVLRRLFQSRIELVFFSYDRDSNGGALSRGFYYQRQRHLWPLTRVDHFRFRRGDLVFEKLLLRQNLVECDSAFFNSVACVGHSASLQNLLELTILTQSSVDTLERKIDCCR